MRLRWRSSAARYWGEGLSVINDDIDFRALSPDQWEDLCFDTLFYEYPGLKRVDGSGGDGGVDAYVGEFSNLDIIFQFKHFKNSFGKPQKREVERSFNAASAHGLSHWILVCSENPTTAMQAWLDEFKSEHADVKIEYILGSEMRARVINHPKVRKQYFPNLQDTLESLSSEEPHDPLAAAARDVRVYNEVLLDDRFKATVITDGEMETVVYSLKPWVKEPVPAVKLLAKTLQGAKAIEGLVKEGSPLELSADDVDFISLIDSSMHNAEIAAIKAFCLTPPRPASLRLFAGDDPAKSYPLHVELRTIREGSEVRVRSNAKQDSSPIVIEMTFRKATPLQHCAVSISPCFNGKTVRQAARGARFLRRLFETKLLGIAEEDADFEDASFTTLDGFSDDLSWYLLGDLFDAIDAICRLFDINPIVTDVIDDPDFVASMLDFGGKLLRNGEEINGSISFGLSEENPDLREKAIANEQICVVVDQVWHGSVFGVTCDADMRITAKGLLELVESEQGDRFRVKGSYRHFIRATTS